MGKNKKPDIAKLAFIQDPSKYNNIDGIEKDNSNEALAVNKDGSFVYRETDPNFNSDVAIIIDNRNVLQFRDDDNLDLSLKATEGFATETEKFILNGGNIKNDNGENVPNYIEDKKSEDGKNNKIYKVGELNVNALRSLNNEQQNV